MTLNIRTALTTDAGLLNKLGFSIYSAHFKHLWVLESEMNDFMKEEYSLPALEYSLRDPGVCWFVAETDGPIGFAKMTWTSTIPGTVISGVLLNKLYLSPQETGKNYGKLIFERVIKAAHERGAGYLWLEVLEQNERARKFYESQGMRHIKDTELKTASQHSILHILGMHI